MRVLIISGMSPTKECPFGGIFIGNRYKYLKNIAKCDLYKIGKVYSNVYKKIYEKIKKDKILQNDVEITVDNILWRSINFKCGIIGKVIEKLNTSLFYEMYLNNNIIHSLEGKYDIIHAHWVYPTGYIAMLLSKKLNIPYIVTAHGSDIHTIPRQNKQILRHTIKVLENASKVIFVSENLKKEALKLGYSGSNSEVIYNGVDLNKFYLEPRELSNSDKKKVVAYVGRLERIKGADRIAKIFKYINENDSNVEFVIIGNGELRKSIIEELDQYDIKYSHYLSLNQEELNRKINTFEVLIVPSRSESFCCVALEAQVCGVKVVANKVGGIPECIGEFGFLVEEGDEIEKRFAKLTLDALQIRINKSEMIKRAKSFSWNNTVEKEYKVYCNVIGKNEGITNEHKFV